MSVSTVVRSVLILLTLAAAAPAAGPRAITKVPYEIKVPGRYLLSRSVLFNPPATSTATAAITISTDDVILDLGDSIIACNPTLGTTQDIAGIRADSRKNITIRGGTVRGFTRAIFLEGTDSTGGHLVENVHADQCTFLGIQVKGHGSIIRRNRVTSVGGTLLGTSARYGIHLTGTGLKVVENDIYNVVPANFSSLTVGIYLNASSSSIVQGNRAATIPTLSSNGGGISLDNCGSTLLAENFTSGWGSPITASGGSGLYRDNTGTANLNPTYALPTYTDGGGNK